MIELLIFVSGFCLGGLGGIACAELPERVKRLELEGRAVEKREPLAAAHRPETASWRGEL